MRQQIAAVFIIVEKIESSIAHESDKQTVTGAIINKPAIRIEEGANDSMNHPGKAKIPRNQPDISPCYWTGIGFVEPEGLFGLDKIAMGAPVIAYTVPI